MTVENHIAVWAAIAAAIYFSFSFLGNVTLSHVLKHFRDGYVQWFVRAFRIRVRADGVAAIDKKRVAVFSTSFSVFFGILFIVSDFVSLNNINAQLALEASTRTNISSLQRVTIVLTMSLIPLMFAMFTNIVFDYVSIKKSYWIARQFLNARISAIAGLIFVDAATSLFLALLAVEAAFTANYTVRQLLIALTPDMYFISDYNCYFCRYWMLVNGAIEGVSITQALREDLRHYIFIGPVFLTTVATTLWLFIYSIFTISISALRRFERACGYFDRLAQARNGMSVVGGMGAALFTVFYWGSYFAL